MKEKPRITLDMDSGQIDAIAEALSFLAGAGVWSQFLRHMSECGWTEEEVDAAYAAFNAIAGRV